MKGHDYDPRHYKFERTIKDFYPEPEANIGDWLVGAVSLVLICVFAAWCWGQV